MGKAVVGTAPVPAPAELGNCATYDPIEVKASGST